MNNTQRAIEKLESDKRRVNRLKFPEDIDTEGTQNIVRFKFSMPSDSNFFSSGEYTRARNAETGEIETSSFRKPGSTSLARRLGSKYSRTTTEIDLFMPAQLQTNYSADWGGSNMGMLGTAYDAGSAVKSMDSFSEIWSESLAAAGRNAGMIFSNALVGTVQGLTPVNAMDFRRFLTSFAFNPYVEVIFNGISNRTFSFTFKLVARNEKEQQSIKQIIKEFKFHRSPELKFPTQYNYWKFPSEVDIQFIHKGKENSWLFKISTCAITNVTVDYTPDGSYAAHEDGSPFSAALTIELIELEQLTKERINEGY